MNQHVIDLLIRHTKAIDADFASLIDNIEVDSKNSSLIEKIEYMLSIHAQILECCKETV